jgi:hypothetical protein
LAPTLFCLVPGLDCRVFGLLEAVKAIGSHGKKRLSVDPDVAI